MINTKPMMPRIAACSRPGLIGTPPKMAGTAQTGKMKSPASPMIADTASPPPACAESMPPIDSIWNCTPAPATSPAGRTFVTALPTRRAATTENHNLVRSRIRRRVAAHTKLAISATSMMKSQRKDR